MTTEDSDSVNAPTTEDHSSDGNAQGRVKWFNNKAGYGFITVTSGEQKDVDVFVHHSAITVLQEQYRYLVQGEYVDFDLCKVDDSAHEWQAGNVKGVNDGKLMCETRLESRQTRTKTHGVSANDGDRHDGGPDGDRRDGDRGEVDRHLSHRGPPQSFKIHSRGAGPRDGDEWMLVRRNSGRGRSSQPTENLRARPPRTARAPTD